MYICAPYMKKYITLQLLILLSFMTFSQAKFLLPVVNENGKWGYLDPSGEQIIPFQYDQAFNFSDERGLVAVSVNGNYKYSYIDVMGNLYGNWNYVEAHPFSNGFALVRFYLDELNLVYGFIDTSAKLSPPLSCSEARSFCGNMAAVNKLSGWGFINKDFKESVRGQYSAVGVFNEGLCPVALGKDTSQRWGFINSKGLEVTQIKYLKASKFSDHMAAVCVEVEDKNLRKPTKRKVYGYVGGNGDFMIPAQYQEAADFSEGKARVKQNGREFFIDPMGKQLFSLDSAFHASDFHEGFAVVTSPGGRAYFIDTKGNIVYDYNFISLTDFKNGFSFFTKRNGVQGYLDYNGNIIWKNK